MTKLSDCCKAKVKSKLEKPYYKVERYYCTKCGEFCSISPVPTAEETKRIKINFKSVNGDNYKVIPAKDIDDTNQRIKKAMKKVTTPTAEETAEQIFRRGCKLENYSASLKVHNLAVWTAHEYATTKTQELRKELEETDNELNVAWKKVTDLTAQNNHHKVLWEAGKEKLEAAQNGFNTLQERVDELEETNKRLETKVIETIKERELYFGLAMRK